MLRTSKFFLQRHTTEHFCGTLWLRGVQRSAESGAGGNLLTRSVTFFKELLEIPNGGTPF